MKKRIISLGFLLMFSTILLISCDDTNTVENIDSKIIPSSNVSYAGHLQPVFDIKCNAKGCHNDQDIAGGLSLTSYSNTTANYLIVAPGDTVNSRLIWTIKGESAYPMPPVGYPPLTPRFHGASN